MWMLQTSPLYKHWGVLIANFYQLSCYTLFSLHVFFSFQCFGIFMPVKLDFFFLEVIFSQSQHPSWSVLPVISASFHCLRLVLGLLWFFLGLWLSVFWTWNALPNVLLFYTELCSLLRGFVLSFSLVIFGLITHGWVWKKINLYSTFGSISKALKK